MQKTDKIFVAGGTGMVGSAIIRGLLKAGYNNLIASYRNRIPADKINDKLTSELVKFVSVDLLNTSDTETFFKNEKPDYVVLAAAKVGGIIANNTYRAQFIFENLQIQNNIIHNSYIYGVKKLLFLGSSCIYPKNAIQPLKEEYLLTNELEYTNEPYAIAKIAGIKMCESYNLQYGTNFISVMPTNLYGPNDNYDLEKSHVLPAIIRKMHLGKCLMEEDWETVKKDFNKNPVEGVSGADDKSKIVAILEKYGLKQENDKVNITLWGSGKPMREFLHADDMASACIFVIKNIDFADPVLGGVKGGIDIQNPKPLNKEIRNTHINIGSGTDLTIADLALLIQNITGFSGNIIWDDTKPDGTLKKLMDVSKIQKLGWQQKYTLEEGIKQVYNEYLT